MIYVKGIIVFIPIVLLAVIGLLSGIAEEIVTRIGSGAYRLQCLLIDWAEKGKV